MDNQEIQPRSATIIDDPVTEKVIHDKLEGHISDQTQGSSAHFDEKNFKPKGAVAFFALLVILGMIIWFGIYFLMLSRI